MIQRPPRTAAHNTRDELIARFAALKLTPVISTNGGEPTADIQCVKGLQPGELIDCWLTVLGAARLDEADAKLAETVAAAHARMTD